MRAKRAPPAPLISKREKALIRMAYMLGFSDGRAEGSSAGTARRQKLLDAAVKLVADYVKESRKEAKR